MNAFYKKIIIIAVAFIALLFAIDYGVQFINFNHLKKAISSEVADKYKIKLKITGDVKLKLLPLPHFQFKKIEAKTIDNQLLFKSFKTEIYPKGILSLSNAAKNLNLRTVRMHHADIHLVSIKEYIQNRVSLNNTSLPNIELVDSAIEVHAVGRHNISNHLITKLNAQISLSAKELYSKAVFDINKQPLHVVVVFPFEEKENSPASLQVFNEAIEVNFTGKLNSMNEAMQILGNVEMKVLDFEKLSAQIDSNQLWGRILKNENITLKANFEATTNYLKINDLNINSKNIQDAVMSFYLGYGQDMLLESTLDIKSINLDEIAQEVMNESTTFQIVDALCLWLMQKFDFSISPELAFNAKLNIQEIKFNQQAMKNLIMQADGLSGDIKKNNGNISINSLQVELPGKGKVALNGVISHNTIRPKFEGDLKIFSNDAKELLKWLKLEMNQNFNNISNIELQTKITLIPHSMRLADLKTAFGEYVFIGDINLREGSDHRINYLSQIRFNSINADNFKVAEILEDIITKLYISDPDRTGEVHTKLTNDFRWLRVIANNFDFDISMNELLFKNKKYNDCNFVFSVGPNKFALERVSFSSELARLNGFISLVLPTFRPYIDVRLDFDFLDTKFIEEIFPSLEKLDAALNKYYAALALAEEKQAPTPGLDSKNTASPNTVASSKETLLTSANFFGANNYDGKIKVKAHNIVHNKSNYDNLDINVVLNNGVLLIDKSSLNAFNGNMVFNGNITLLSSIPSLAISFALYNIDPALLTTPIFNFNKIRGYMSASGSFATSGTSFNNMIQRLQGEILVVGKRIIVQGFDLGELIAIPDLPMNLAEKKKRLEYFSKYGESLFDNIKGKISISGGMADLTNFTLENNRASGSFSARYSILHKLINSICRFSFIPIGTAKPLNIQYTIKGHLDALEQEASLTELQNYVTAKAADAGENIAPSAVDRESVLKKRLK